MSSDKDRGRQAGALGVSDSVDICALEFLQRAHNCFATIDQRWKDIAVRESLGWAEGYEQGAFEIGIIQNLRSDRDRVLNVATWLKADRVANGASRWPGEVGHGRSDDASDNCQRSVFVGIVDFLEGPNGKIPSLCWIDYVQKRVGDWRNCWIVESAFDYSFKVLSVGGHWESDAFVRTEFFSKHGAYEMVERVPQIANDITDDQGNGEMIERLCFYANNLQLIRSLRLFDHQPNAVLDVVRNGLFEVSDVVRGPMGF